MAQPSNSKFSFSIDCLCLIPLVLGLTLTLASLFTISWYDERWEFDLASKYDILKWIVGDTKPLASYRRCHGLYSICTQKFIGGQQMVGWSRFVKNQGQLTVVTDGRYECMNRFQRDDFKVGVERIDNVIGSYYNRAIGSEIAELALICISCFLNLLAVVSFVFLRQRFPIVLTLIVTLAFACSLSAVIVFAVYHKGTDLLRDKLLTALMTETGEYGYSFWLAVSGCCSQFLASVCLLICAIRQCWRICCTDYTPGRLD